MTNYQTINLQAVAAVVVANWFLFLRYLPANFATTRYLQCLNECSFLAATYTWPLLAKIQNKVPWDIFDLNKPKICGKSELHSFEKQIHRFPSLVLKSR